ncbi:MAG TPA: hypothetical protein VGM63_15190 [Mucilaginibacter sp.]|jgi:hypothetical protein
MSYTKELQQKINQLEDNFDVQAVELILLENELKDNMQVNILVSKLTQHILQMLMEYADFIRNRTPTDAHKKSHKRLIELLDISSQLFTIGTNNQAFKLYNRELVGKINLLRLEKTELKQQLENATKAENF